MTRYADNLVRASFTTLLLFGTLGAIGFETQGEILRSARQADMASYYYSTGVVLYDTPTISPFFACLRAHIYKGYDVNGTLMVDRVSCQYNSYYRQAWQGIQMCNNGNKAGKAYIDRSIVSAISYGC